MATEGGPVSEPKEVRNWRLYAYCFALCCGGIAGGYDSSVMGGMLILPAFERDFRLGNKSDKELDDLTSNILSAMQAGTFFGALGSYWFAERFGRKRSLVGCISVFLAGAILMSCSGGKLPVLITGRAVAGLGLGAMSPIVPTYVSEMAPPSIRGRLMGLLEMSCQGAQMFGFWANYLAHRTITKTAGPAQWLVPMSLQLLPGLAMLLATPFCPETPRWLCKKGRLREAQAALCRVRALPSGHPYIKHEMGEMEAEVASEAAVTGQAPTFKSQLKQLTRKGIRNRFAIGLCLMMFQNMTGVNVITYYSPRIFAALGITSTDKKLFATGFYGVAKTVGTVLFCFWVADRLGRRRGLIYGAFAGAVPLFYIGGYMMKAPPAGNRVSSSACGYLAMVCIYLFGVVFCASWQGITSLYASEIFPLHIRSLCMALTVADERLWTYVISQSTPYMISNLGCGTYFFFGSLMVVMGIWSMWCVRETKEMDRLFGADHAQATDEEMQAAVETRTESPQANDANDKPPAVGQTEAGSASSSGRAGGRHAMPVG